MLPRTMEWASRLCSVAHAALPVPTAASVASVMTAVNWPQRQEKKLWAWPPGCLRSEAGLSTGGRDSFLNIYDFFCGGPVSLRER